MKKLDKWAKLQAEEYANIESEITGNPVGSPQWRKAYKEYEDFAVGTMSVGRAGNPRAKIERYIEAGNANLLIGIAKKLAKNYKTKDSKNLPIERVQARIVASASNIVNLFMNATLGIRNEAMTHDIGRIPDSEMSALQFKNRGNKTEQDHIREQKRTITMYLLRDMLETIMLNYIEAFLSLEPTDVQEIFTSFEIKNANLEDLRTSEFRKIFVLAIKDSIHKLMPSMNMAVKKSLLRSEIVGGPKGAKERLDEVHATQDWKKYYGYKSKIKEGT